jgi:hypothetical protein
MKGKDVSMAVIDELSPDYMEMWERRINERAQAIHQTIVKERAKEAVIQDGQNGHSENIADVKWADENIESGSGTHQK